MRKFLLVAVLLAGCRLSHDAALELRYSGVVALTGGTLLVAAPALNGDPLARGTTVVGLGLDLVGVGMIAWSYAADPGAPAVTFGCAK